MDSDFSHPLWFIKVKITGNIMYGIPCDWILHTAPYGYTDHDEWFKPTIKFTYVYMEDKTITKNLLWWSL